MVCERRPRSVRGESCFGAQACCKILTRGDLMSVSSSISSPKPGQHAQVSPVRLFEAINGFHLTEAIRSAIELDIFTVIGAGHNTSRDIARQCEIAERGARILCDFLVVNGFLKKSGQEYSL